MDFEKVLVTGATGFIGGHLTRYLAHLGYKVRVLAREKSPNLYRISGVHVEVFEGDIRCPETLLKAVSGVHKVFHCAGLATDWAPSQTFYDVHVTGTENVLKACLKAKVHRFIGISTNDVFGRIEGRLIDESFPLKKWGEPYPDTKILAEQLVWTYCKSFGLPVAVVYPCWVYGPDDTNFFPHVMKAVVNRQLVFWRKKALMWPTFIENLLDLMHLISTDTRAVGHGYLVHDGKSVYFQDFCNRIADSIGMKPIHSQIPYCAAYGAAVVLEPFWRLLRIRSRPPITTYVVKNLGSRHQYSMAKATRELGWGPKIGFEEGFAKTMEAFRPAFDSVKRQWL